MMDFMAERLFTPKEAADFLGVSERTLQIWRMEGRGSRFIKVASNKVRYSPMDLRVWLETRSAHKTSDFAREGYRERSG